MSMKLNIFLIRGEKNESFLKNEYHEYNSNKNGKNIAKLLETNTMGFGLFGCGRRFDGCGGFGGRHGFKGRYGKW